MEQTNSLKNNKQSAHVDIREELLFYRKVASGDISAVQKTIAAKKFQDMYGAGTLSSDPLINIKYHMVITAGIITRICIDNGMEVGLAFNLSEHYIQKLDHVKEIDEVVNIHDRMIMDFTRHMRQYSQKSNLSQPISICLDYIFSHLSERITLKELADYSNVSTTYLSKTFSEEIGMSVSEYIRIKKINMSKEMLLNTNMSILDIAHHLSFSSQSHYTQVFKSEVGMTPKNFRKNNTYEKWILKDEQ